MTGWNRTLAALVALVLVVLAACSGGDSNEPDCDAIAAALVSRIEITPSEATVNLGDSVQLAATAYSCAGALGGVSSFAWRSANAAAASVSPTGMVKAVASSAPVAIFAQAQGKEGSAAISTRPVPVARVTVEPATATVGVNRTSTLTVRAFDAQDREILGRPVTWSSASPAIASVNQSGGVTGAAPGGPVAVTATIEGQSDASQVTVVLVAVNTVTVAPTTATIAAGTTQQFTATLRDELGNVLAGRAINWTSSDPSIATVTGAGGLAEGRRPGTVTITASSEGRSGTAQLTVNVGAAARLVFVQQPSAVQAGSTIVPAVTVEIQDAAGNRVTTGNPTVTLGLTPGGATLGGNSATASNGLATFNALTVSAAGTFSLTASSTGLTGGTSGAFVVTARPATRLAFVQPPTNVVAGASVSPAVTVELEDALGDRVTTSGVPVTIAIGANPGTGTLGGTLTQNTVNGLATFANLTVNRTGSGYTLAASATGLAGATSGAFNVTAGAANRVGFVTEPCPTACVLGSALAPAPRVAIQDALGNTVTTSTATVAVTLLGGQGNPTLGGTTSVAAVAGIATFPTLTVSRRSTGLTLRAASGSLTPDTSAAFSIVNSGPQLSFATEPPASVAAGATLPAVRVQLQDAQGGNLATAGVQVTLAIGPSDTLKGTLTRATDASGLATFSNLSVAAPAGASYILTATATGYLSEPSSPFAVTVGAPSQLSFTQPPPASVTVGLAIAPAVSVQLRDAGGNAVSQPGTTVTLGMSGGGSLTNGSVATNASGLAVFTGLSASASAGPGYTLTAAAPGLSPRASDTFSVVAGAAASLRFVQQPSTVTAGAVIAPAVTVEAVDAGNNRATGFSSAIGVALTVAGGATLGGTTTVNAVAGVASFSNLAVSGAAGTYSLSATAAGLSGSTSNSFTVNALPSFTLTVATAGTGSGGVTSNPAGISCGTAGSDCAQSYAVGTQVTLTASAGAGSAFSGWSGGGCTGIGTCVVTLSAATSVTASFALEPDEVTTLTFGQPPTDEEAGASIAPAVTVVARGAGSNPVANATVTLSVVTGPGGASLNDAVETTNASGVATFTDLDATVAGTYTIRATSGAVQSLPSASFVITPSAPAALAIRTQPTGGTAGGAVTPTVQVEVRDAYGNLVTSYTDQVVLDVSTGPVGGSVSNNSTSAVGGIATFSSLTASTAGTYTLEATATGLASAITNEFSVAAALGGARQLGFLVQPSNVDENTAISPAVRVEVRDANGGRVSTSTATVTLAFGVNAGGATLSGNTSRAASGVATFSNLRVSAPGNGYRLVATSGTLQSATSTTFRVRED